LAFAPVSAFSPMRVASQRSPVPPRSTLHMMASTAFGGDRRGGAPAGHDVRALALSTLQRTRPYPDQFSAVLRNEYPDLTQKDIGYLMGQLKKGGRWQAVIILLDYARQHTGGASTIMFTTAISASGQARQCRPALRVFAQMREAGCAPRHPPCAPMAMPIHPRPLFPCLGSVEQTAITWNAALSACERVGEVSRCLQLFQEMREAEVSPTEASFNIAISACAKGGKAAEAAVLLEDMASEGLPPSTITYNAMLNVYVKTGDWASAWEVFEDLRARGDADQWSYATLISGFESRDDWETALNLLSEMQASGLRRNAATYNAVLKCLARSGQWQTALQLLSRMQTDGVKPNVISFGSALQACEKAGQAEQAVQLLKQMRSCGLEPTTRVYSAALSACEKGRNGMEAKWVLGEMRSRGVALDAIASKAAIMALCKAGEVHAALDLLPTLDMDALGGEAYSVYWALSQAAGQQGMDEVASRMEGEMRRRGMTSSSKQAVASWTPGTRRVRPQMLSSATKALTTRSGDSRDATSTQCRQLVEQLLEKTGYEYDTTALPYLFVRNSTTAMQHTSLMYHCDKKALAAALSDADDDRADVHVKVNIKMCSDCHSAYKHTSALLQRTLVCEDGSHHHVFENGRCSCNDRWR